MSASKLLYYISSDPAAFGFWASLLYNITLNSANNKSDWSLSDFKSGIGLVVHTTLDTKHLIYHKELLLFIQLPVCKIPVEE